MCDTPGYCSSMFFGKRENYCNLKKCQTSVLVNARSVRGCQGLSKMRQSNFECIMSHDRKTPSRRCCTSDPEATGDTELKQIFHELAVTLFRLMDCDDADILVRSELRGQTPSEIAAEIGCTRTEAALRLKHAHRCFCQLVILTLAPTKS